MKNVIVLMLAGAVVGATAASLMVPPMLSWYTSPGGLPQGAAIQAVVNIPDVIRYATTRLLWGQTVGGAIGAVAGLAISVAFSRGRRPAPRVSPPPSAP